MNARRFFRLVFSWASLLFFVAAMAMMTTGLLLDGDAGPYSVTPEVMGIMRCAALFVAICGLNYIAMMAMSNHEEKMKKQEQARSSLVGAEKRNLQGLKTMAQTCSQIRNLLEGVRKNHLEIRELIVEDLLLESELIGSQRIVLFGIVVSRLRGVGFGETKIRPIVEVRAMAGSPLELITPRMIESNLNQVQGEAAALISGVVEKYNTWLSGQKVA